MTLAQAQEIAAKATFTMSSPIHNNAPVDMWDIRLAEPIGSLETLAVPTHDRQTAYDELIERLLPIEFAQ